MNYSRFNFELIDDNNKPILNQYQTARLWLIKFWQFSLFYGNYLASLHSKKAKN